MGKCWLLPPALLFLALSAVVLPAAAAAGAACHPEDLLALRAFAGNLTAGGDVLLRAAWSGGDSCCGWEGVGCDGAGGRVTALRLPGRELAGPIPGHSLAGLARLEVLDLSRNALSGGVSALAAIAGLRAADLSSNLLVGPLPDLTALPGLVAFNASNNSLSGALGPDLCAGAPALRVLDLSCNRLAGALPSSASPPPCAARLQELFLGTNAFSGALPASLFGLVGLRKLSLASNGLAGQVSSRLRDLRNLTLLDLSVNRFSGRWCGGRAWGGLGADLEAGERDQEGGRRPVGAVIGGERRRSSLCSRGQRKGGEHCISGEERKRQGIGAGCARGRITAYSNRRGRLI